MVAGDGAKRRRAGLMFGDIEGDILPLSLAAGFGLEDLQSSARLDRGPSKAFNRCRWMAIKR